MCIRDSFIGLWNQIFLGTYIAMFLAMPFAYFFTESEGFAGSRKVCVGYRYRFSIIFFIKIQKF